MGKLIKNHWARLIILTAAAYQLLAALEAFFWPKVFWDFLTTTLDGAVRPVPYLQILNLLFALLTLCWEWPLPLFTAAAERGYYLASAHRRVERSPASSTKTTTTTNNNNKIDTSALLQVDRRTRFLAAMHRSIEARLLIYPLSTLAALLLYQGTNAGLYYIIGMGVYFWGFTEGEVVMGKPWQLPRVSGRVFVV